MVTEVHDCIVSWDVSIHKWARWSSGEKTEIAFIDPLMRRRLSPLAQGALHVANACSKDSPHSAGFVFSSRHGELQRTMELLHTLACDEDMSPTLFSLSVLNSAAGVFSIARKDQAPATAISAGVESFGYGLLEASLRARKQINQSIIYVYADAPAPAPLGKQPCDPDTSFALGMVISAPYKTGTANATRLSTEIKSKENGSPPEKTSQVFAFLRALECGVADWASSQHRWQWLVQ